jgi:NADH-quinone oxidoreductase subunit K
LFRISSFGFRASSVARIMDIALLQGYLLVGAVLFGLGLVGFLSRRNMIVMFLCAEMMLLGVSLSLVAWGRYHNDWGGQTLVIFILTVAACEAGIALALVLALYQRSGSLDIALWQHVRETEQPAYVDRELPEEPDRPHEWPHLTPAGRQPELPAEDVLYRDHV